MVQVCACQPNRSAHRPGRTVPCEHQRPRSARSSPSRPFLPCCPARQPAQPVPRRHAIHGRYGHTEHRQVKVGGTRPGPQRLSFPVRGIAGTYDYEMYPVDIHVHVDLHSRACTSSALRLGTADSFSGMYPPAERFKLPDRQEKRDVKMTG